MKPVIRLFSVRLSSRYVSSQPQTSQGLRGAAVRRPELDFDYLLDDENRETIRRDIRDRKGIGDIDRLHEKWNRLQMIMEGEQKVQEEEYARLWNELYHEAATIPNRTHPEAPRGPEDKARVVDILNEGSKRESEGLRTAENIVKSWRSLFHPTESCGQRSYAYIGALARLEEAILDYVWSRVLALGFTPIQVSDIVPLDVGQSCGLLNEGMQYTLSSDPTTCLSGTAEMGISSSLQGSVFPSDRLPLRFVGRSRCFRPEISKLASEAKLYRVHEFNKVEMFTVCSESQSDSELSYLVSVQKDILSSLGLHCRVLDMPTEELGASAYRKYDIEAWMPGRKLFGEVSSASNCTDFQSRRLGIRYMGSSGRRLCHTCNGTAIAVPRALIALLETFQDEKRRGNLFKLPDPIAERMQRFNEQGEQVREEKIKFQTAPSFYDS